MLALLAAACVFPLGLRPGMSPRQARAALHRRAFEPVGDDTHFEVHSSQYRGAFGGIDGAVVEASFAARGLFAVQVTTPPQSPVTAAGWYQRLVQRAHAACGRPARQVDDAVRWRSNGLAVDVSVAQSVHDESARVAVWRLIALDRAPRWVLHSEALDGE